MWQGSISLQGRLFIQAFKSFTDGDIESAANLIPLLTLKFKELDIVLRHDNKQQLLDFFEFLKKKTDGTNEQQQANRFKDIDLILYNIRQSLQPKKESQEELLAKGRQALKEHKEGQALAFFNLALDLKETQEVLLHIADIHLNSYQQIKEFQFTVERAMKCQPDKQVLPAYEALISQMQYHIGIDLNFRFKVIRRAISLNSKNPNVYLELAIVGLKLHMKLGEYQNTVEQNCPDSIEKPFALGVINFSQQYWSKAEKMFQACQQKIRINNSNRIIAERRLRQNGDDSLFRKVSNFKKQDQLYYFMGKVSERLKVGKQVQMYEKGLKHNPSNIQIWKQMIRLIQKQPGRQAELLCIIQHLNTFSQYVFSIRDSAINETIIQLLFQSGEKETAIEYALGLIASFPDLDLAYYLVAKVYYNLGQNQKCKEYCRKCLILNGKNQGVFFFLGKIAFDQQNYDVAREQYNRATQLNPKQYLAHFNLGILQYKLCNYEQAAKALELAIICASGFSPAYELLIHAYMKQGKFYEAREKVINLPNQNQSFLAYFYYAKISYQQGKDKEAEKYFKLVLEKQPDHWDSIYKLVVINVSQLNRKDLSVLPQSRTVQAESYVSKLLNAPVVKGRYKAAKAYLLLRQNRHEQAIQILMQAISQQKQEFQAYFHLGYALRDRITDIDNLSQELQDLISCNQANIESYYFSSLFYLGFKAFDYFLEKFNKYIRCPKTSQTQNRRQTMRIYRNIITHLEHLLRFYPDDNDLILLLGILYRDVANRQKTLRYFQRLQSKLFVQEQTDLLFNKFLRFYNQNSKYQQNINYLQYIFEFIFLEVYEMDEMQGMMLCNYLIEAHDFFSSNEGIRFAIQERKREIVSMNLMHVVGRQIEELDGEWRKEISKGNHFVEGRKIMEAAKNKQQEWYKRCLVYQFYCNKIYPYVYNEQKSIKSLQDCLAFLLDPKHPKETQEQLYQLTRSKLNPILFTKAQSSYQPYLSQNYKIYESNIFFAQFQTEQLQPFTFDCRHVQLSFKKYRINANPKSNIQPPKFQFKYLNSLQKNVMKKPLQTQSLIMIARSSIINGSRIPKSEFPRPLASIFPSQQDQLPFD